MTRTCLIIALLTSLVLCGCKRDYEEFYFKGIPIGAQMCSGTQMGYLMVLERPEGIGDTVTYNGTLYRNAVCAYRPPRLLAKGDTLFGVAYLYKNFAALNCQFVSTYTLPEIALISVDEDPALIENRASNQ